MTIPPNIYNNNNVFAESSTHIRPRLIFASKVEFSQFQQSVV